MIPSNWLQLINYESNKILKKVGTIFLKKKGLKAPDPHPPLGTLIHLGLWYRYSNTQPYEIIAPYFSNCVQTFLCHYVIIAMTRIVSKFYVKEPSLPQYFVNNFYSIKALLSIFYRLYFYKNLCFACFLMVKAKKHMYQLCTVWQKGFRFLFLSFSFGYCTLLYTFISTCTYELVLFRLRRFYWWTKVFVSMHVYILIYLIFSCFVFMSFKTKKNYFFFFK